MIPILLARESYGYGAAVYRARSTGGTPKPPAQVDPFFYNLGEDDAQAGRIRNFDGATVAASSAEEQNAYDLGFDGQSPPSNPALRPFWDGGRQDRAEGRFRTWTSRSPIAVAPPAPSPNGGGYPPPVSPAPLPNGGSPVRPAPPYQGGSSPGPVVVVNPPPRYGGYPPPRRQPRRRSGLVLYGDWGRIDLSQLFGGLGL